MPLPLLTTKLDFTGELALHKEATFEYLCVVIDGGLPFNLAGCSVLAQARRSYDAPIAIDFYCQIQDAEAGEVLLTAIPSLFPRVGTYLWDLRITLPSGDVWIAIAGKLDLLGIITHGVSPPPYIPPSNTLPLINVTDVDSAADLINVWDTSAAPGFNSKGLILGDLVTLVSSGIGSGVQSTEADEEISANQAIYIKSNGHCALAIATDPAKSRVAGFAVSNTAIGFSCDYRTSGIVTGLSGLSLGSIYHLSDSSAGQITQAPPSVGYIAPIGKALAVSTLLISIYPITRL